MARPPKRYFVTLDRNGTEGQITLHSPEGKPMMRIVTCNPEFDDDLAWLDADQLQADADLIVEALNVHRKAARWGRALGAAEVYLRLPAMSPIASPELRKMHRRLLNALCA